MYDDTTFAILAAIGILAGSVGVLFYNGYQSRKKNVLNEILRLSQILNFPEDELIYLENMRFFKKNPCESACVIPVIHNPSDPENNGKICFLIGAKDTKDEATGSPNVTIEAQVPAGKREDTDPDPVTTAIRETEEETKIKLNSNKLIGPYRCGPGNTGQYVAVYFLIVEKMSDFVPEPAEKFFAYLWSKVNRTSWKVYNYDTDMDFKVRGFNRRIFETLLTEKNKHVQHSFF